MQREDIHRIISKDHADNLRPIVKWVHEAAPRKKLRIAAASLLPKLSGIKDWKQVSLSRAESDLLDNIDTTFTGGSIGEGKQGKFKGF